eukprot:3481780-Rhodomonas_salina.2
MRDVAKLLAKRGACLLRTGQAAGERISAVNEVLLLFRPRLPIKQFNRRWGSETSHLRANQHHQEQG